tara:strand:- start:1 stop:552 length:552 start_codon:yes stop_codon:yes gene_type:complete
MQRPNINNDPYMKKLTRNNQQKTIDKIRSGQEVPNAPEGSWDVLDGGKHTPHMSPACKAMCDKKNKEIAMLKQMCKDKDKRIMQLTTALRMTRAVLKNAKRKTRPSAPPPPVPTTPKTVHRYKKVAHGRFVRDVPPLPTSKPPVMQMTVEDMERKWQEVKHGTKQPTYTPAPKKPACRRKPRY